MKTHRHATQPRMQPHRLTSREHRALPCAALALLAMAALTDAAELPAPPPFDASTLAVAANSGPPPAEPETRTLTAEEAEAALVRDWLFQADDYPTPAKVRREIEATRAIAKRIGAKACAAELVRLAEIETSLAMPATAPVPAPNPPAGRIAGWSFDGSGGTPSKKHGPWDQEEGVHGQSAVLSGGAWLDAGAELGRVFSGAYTITGWIRTQSGEADILGTGTAHNDVLLMTYRGVLRGHHWTEAGLNVLDGSIPVADGQWHHVAQVVSEGRLAVIVDGKPDGECPLKGTPGVPSAPVLIGARAAATESSRFRGALDELAVFSRALTAKDLAALHDAGRRGIEAAGRQVREPWLAVRRLKRAIFLRDPAIDFESLIFIDNPLPAGREWAHEARHRNGMMAQSGGRLLRLDGLHPGGRLTKLAPSAGPASFWRPDVSFDGRRVLFCMKPAGDKSFHLYEVGGDGAGLRQITRSDYDDLDPIYLPGGRIMFSTSRCQTYIRCMPYTYSYVLARCDPDGRNLYIVSQNNEPDWLPSLLPDGRVVYTRWEYTDKALWRIQSLWTVNPDGTGAATLWGNQSVWPDMLIEPRPIPGSQRVMFIGAAHHDWFAGPVGIVDPQQGHDFPHGLTRVTAEVPWAECGPPPVDAVESKTYRAAGRFAAYKSPFPLSEKLFLVSARGGGLVSGDRHARDAQFRLYLMDSDGNRELIYAGAYNVLHAQPLRARPEPPVIPDRVAWPGTGREHTPAQPGVMFSGDVYQGPTGLPRGSAKWLRVVQMDPRTFSTWDRDVMPHTHQGPAVSILQSDGLKRILGEVPVADDGSVAFEAPPGAALHFQLLDEKRRALQTMRSFTGVMPGERRGCVGCHAGHSAAPFNAPAAALLNAPAKPDPPPWGARTSLSYERHIHPLLEKHCAACHSGEAEGRAAFDVTLRPGQGIFKEPYVTLVSGNSYHGPKSLRPPDSIAGCLPVETWPIAGAPESVSTFAPMQYLSLTSRLVNHYAGGRHRTEATMSADELRLLAAWVDMAAPYRNEEDVRAIPDPEFAGIEQLPVRPRVRTAPVVDRFNLPQDRPEHDSRSP